MAGLENHGTIIPGTILENYLPCYSSQQLIQLRRNTTALHSLRTFDGLFVILLQ